jgi:hypothetical protein
VLLSFDSSEDIEEGFDFAYVEVSGDGGAFLPMAVYTGAFSGRRTIDLSLFGGQEIRLRFRLLSDGLLSAPLFQGWFIDNIALESADFRALATVDGGTLAFDVQPTKTRAVEPRTEFYRVGGLFGSPCDENGPFSNVRAITVAPRVELPHWTTRDRRGPRPYEPRAHRVPTARACARAHERAARRGRRAALRRRAPGVERHDAAGAEQVREQVIERRGELELADLHRLRFGKRTLFAARPARRRAARSSWRRTRLDEHAHVLRS